MMETSFETMDFLHLIWGFTCCELIAGSIIMILVTCVTITQNLSTELKVNN
jgi:hypothetical protein